MQHVYRQVAGLQRYRTVVLAEERCEESLYPFREVEILPKPRMNPLGRLYSKFVLREPSLVYRGGVNAIRSVTDRHPQAALMHVYFGHSGVHLLPFIERWDKPVVVSFHGMDAMPRRQHRDYLPRLQRLFAVVPLVLVRSESLGRVLVERGCPPEKIRLNRTSVPLESFAEVDRAQRDIRGQRPADSAVILQASRLIEKKGLDLTLRAFADANKKFPGSRLVLAGEGPLQESLQSLATELDIADRVSFPGFLPPDKLAAEFAAADVFIHPSRVTSSEDQEGVPNSMLEAMATGLPVLATHHGGIPEVVSDGVHGLLCPENDLPAITGGLLRLMENPEERLEMGHRAAQMVRAEFDANRRIAALESCYDEARELWNTRPTG
jgi:colanic acid/amylovoran biosynthesis glycosyltransferase